MQLVNSPLCSFSFDFLGTGAIIECFSNVSIMDCDRGTLNMKVNTNSEDMPEDILTFPNMKTAFWMAGLFLKVCTEYVYLFCWSSVCTHHCCLYVRTCM